jgi:hypothetical protein
VASNGLSPGIDSITGQTKHPSFSPSRDTHGDALYIISPPPSTHLRLFWQEKNIKFHFPATTEQNIARVNLFRKPSDSSILRAIDAIDAIFSDQVNL